jgi:hypothetical protein
LLRVFRAIKTTLSRKDTKVRDGCIAADLLAATGKLMTSSSITPRSDQCEHQCFGENVVNIASQKDEYNRIPLQVTMGEATVLIGVSRTTLIGCERRGRFFFGRMRGRAMVPMSEIQRVHKLVCGDGAIDKAPVSARTRVAKIRLYPKLR